MNWRFGADFHCQRVFSLAIHDYLGKMKQVLSLK